MNILIFEYLQNYKRYELLCKKLYKAKIFDDEDLIDKIEKGILFNMFCARKIIYEYAKLNNLSESDAYSEITKKIK